MRNRIVLALGAVLGWVSTALAQPAPEMLPPPNFPEATYVAPSRGGSFSVTADYLIAFVRGTNLGDVVTTAPSGTARPVAGVLGEPTTSTLFGGWQNGDMRSGIRIGATWWCGPEQRFGLDGGFTMLESRAALFSATSTDGTILARPYISTNTGTPQAVLVAFPGSSNGSIDVRAASANFYTLHLDVVEKAIDEGWFRFYGLFGYRFYRYDESLRVRQSIQPTNLNFIPGTEIVSNDVFSTHNVFHGGDLGFRTQFNWDRFSLDVLTKVAVGRVFRETNIGGDQVTTVPGLAPITQSGGVFALATNSGTFGSRDWKVMPEFTATLTWQIRPNVHARVGYTFLLLNGVMRAADQVDTTLNPNFFPGGNASGAIRPAFQQIRTDMWIQSVNVGLEFTF
jgi:Putative beta barrel porin-7 (BBP7)